MYCKDLKHWFPILSLSFLHKKIFGSKVISILKANHNNYIGFITEHILKSFYSAYVWMQQQHHSQKAKCKEHLNYFFYFSWKVCVDEFRDSLDRTIFCKASQDVLSVNDNYRRRGTNRKHCKTTDVLVFYWCCNKLPQI